METKQYIEEFKCEVLAHRGHADLILALTNLIIESGT